MVQDRAIVAMADQ